jgi:hypothetical protein
MCLSFESRRGHEDKPAVMEINESYNRVGSAGTRPDQREIQAATDAR